MTEETASTEITSPEQFIERMGEEKFTRLFDPTDVKPPEEPKPKPERIVEIKPGREIPDDEDEPIAEREPITNLEDGVQRLLNTQDEKAEQRAEQRTEPKGDTPETESPYDATDPSDEAVWSTAEVQAMAQHGQARQQASDAWTVFQQQLAHLQQNGSDQNAEVQYRIRETVKQFQERHDQLQSWQQQIEGIGQERVQKRYLSREAKKLKAALPNFNADDAHRVRKYLLKSGLSDDEVNSISDHQTIVRAEKARRYDEGQKKQRPRNTKPIKVRHPNERSDKGIPRSELLRGEVTGRERPLYEKDTKEAALFRLRKYKRGEDAVRYIELSGKFDPRRKTPVSPHSF